VLFCFCICGRDPIAAPEKLDDSSVAASRPLYVVWSEFVTLMLGMGAPSPPPCDNPLQGPDRTSPALAEVEDGGLKAGCEYAWCRDSCDAAGLAVADRDKMSAVLTGFFWP